MFPVRQPAKLVHSMNMALSYNCVCYAAPLRNRCIHLNIYTTTLVYTIMHYINNALFVVTVAYPSSVIDFYYNRMMETPTAI